MTFKSKNTAYTVVSTILKGEVNDIFTARPEYSADGREFTLIVIHVV